MLLKTPCAYSDGAKEEPRCFAPSAISAAQTSSGSSGVGESDGQRFVDKHTPAKGYSRGSTFCYSLLCKASITEGFVTEAMSFRIVPSGRGTSEATDA